jgi:hypothetical protein
VAQSATGWTTGVRFPAGAKFFSLRRRVQTGSEAHPALDLMCTGGSFPEVKWHGRETDHSHPSSAEVKNAMSYTSTPPYVFMAWCMVTHRGNFTLPNYCVIILS